MKRLSTSAVALAAAAFFSAGAGATDILDRKYDPAPDYQKQVNWTGFFVGGQFGYGIASQRVTTLSTEHFDAVPSKCYNLFEKSDETALDRDPEDPEDDGILSFSKSISFVSTNNTEEGCEEVVGEFGTVEHDGGYWNGYTQTTGFDPAVDAHDLTTKTVDDGADSGLIGGLQVGFDKQMGRVIAGVFGDYNWSDINGKNNDWTVGGRIGFLIDTRLMVYGLAGYTRADYDEADYEGWTVGGGLEYAASDNIFVGGKYNYTDLGEETIADTPALNIVSDRDEHKILVDLKIKLNSF